MATISHFLGLRCLVTASITLRSGVNSQNGNHKTKQTNPDFQPNLPGLYPGDPVNKNSALVLVHCMEAPTSHCNFPPLKKSVPKVGVLLDTSFCDTQDESQLVRSSISQQKQDAERQSNNIPSCPPNSPESTMVASYGHTTKI